jgi:hypothetical protein
MLAQAKEGIDSLAKFKKELKKILEPTKKSK